MASAPRRAGACAKRDGTSSASPAGRSPEASTSLRADVTRFDDVSGAFDDRPAAAACSSTPRRRSGPWRRCPRATRPSGGARSRSTCSVPTTSCAPLSPVRLARDGGLAIHLTSGAAARAKPYWSAYSASKAGAEHLVRSAAADVAGHRLRCLRARPGDHRDAHAARAAVAGLPRPRSVPARLRGADPVVRADEVAEAISELSRARARGRSTADAEGRCALMVELHDAGRQRPGRDRPRRVRAHAAALPALPQPDRRRRAGDVRHPRRAHPDHAHGGRRAARRCSTGSCPTSGTSATPTSRRRTARASSTSGDSTPARRRLQRAGAHARCRSRSCASACSRCPSSPT